MSRIVRSLPGIKPAPMTRSGWHRLRMAAMMLFSDLMGLSLAIVFGHLATGTAFSFLFFDPDEIEHILVLGIILLVFLTSRLYPGVGIDPAEEFKLVTQYSSSAMFIGMIVGIVLHHGRFITILVMLIVWAFSVFNVLFLRWSLRILTVQLGIWGEPVAVFARGAQAEEIVQYFLQRRRLGFLPVVAATDSDDKTAIANLVPVVNINSLIKGSSSNLLKDVETILIDASFFGQNFSDNTYNRLSNLFPQMIFVSDMGWLEGAALAIHNFEGLSGIEARRNLLSPFSLAIKRSMDLLGSLLAMLLFSPFLLLTIAIIKLDSPGSVFYTQPRVGKNGKNIQIYKFRTMVTNAEQVLAKYLKENTQAQREWDETQKLRDDPRITRVGKFLRKFSIDEIPQLFNVFLGEMSLVGPRPIMLNQSNLYGESIEVYYSMRPGMTGLWQVSGRNRTTFQERARFDVYYVRHWSVWMDIYILLRTIWVVLSHDGAF